MVIGADARPPSGETLPDVVAATCDLANGAEAASTLNDLSARYGPPDVLVNCAGRIANSPLIKRGPDGWEVHDFALWNDVIASSLTSAFHATAVCARLMLEARRKGVVVNISSVCASGNPGQAAYSAAKAGLNGMTLALGKELGPLGIRVVGLAPGYFETASTTRNVSEARLAKVVGAVPLKRLGQVAEIADAIDFIIRNEYVNGTIVELDGGLVV
jgi:3-oxoacyl-[acyl-carrier protein] reductase